MYNISNHYILVQEIFLKTFTDINYYTYMYMIVLYNVMLPTYMTLY